MKTFISFSGGVESTAMCVLYGADAAAVFCDTGWEHREMYDRIDYVERRIRDIHPGFEVIRIRGSAGSRGRVMESLPDYIEDVRYMPSKMNRYCTSKFKIRPIERFLKKEMPCRIMIGFNADEGGRTGNAEMLKDVEYSYPLIADGYDRIDCENLLLDLDLHPQWPPYMSRGGCRGCIFKSVAEFKAMYFFDRETFDELAALERRVQDRRQKFFTLSMSLRSFSDMARECEDEIRNWGEDEIGRMYSKVKSDRACGAFCHR